APFRQKRASSRRRPGSWGTLKTRRGDDSSQNPTATSEMLVNQTRLIVSSSNTHVPARLWSGLRTGLAAALPAAASAANNRACGHTAKADSHHPAHGSGILGGHPVVA